MKNILKLSCSGLVLYSLLLVLHSCTGSSDNEESENAPSQVNTAPSNTVFKNELQNAGFDDLGHLGQTAAWGDINGDGYQDIVIGNTDLRGPSFFLYKNNKGKFENKTADSGFFDQPIRSFAWADYDNDGDIDLAVGTIRAGAPPVLYRNEGGFKFLDVTKDAGIVKTGGFIFNNIWSDYNLDGFVDLFQINAVELYLHKNNGDGTFSEVSGEAGIQKENNQIFTNGAVLFDINNDMYPDLFVSNSGRDNLFLNNGDGTFKNITTESGLGDDTITNSKGGCTGDFNNDGFIDLYIGSVGKRGNVLYKNNGDGTFTNITQQTGTRDVGDARTCSFIDYDSDGLLDILTTNHLSPNKLYRNLGDEKFEDTAVAAGLDKPVIDVFGAAWGDYNNNGFMDVFLNGHIGIGLFKNRGNNNNNLTIKLVGNGTNTNISAISSRVTVMTPSGTQTREVSGGRACCEQDMLPLHFGTGQEKVADIDVTWTDKSTCSYKNISVDSNTFITVNQAGCELTRKN